MAYCIVASAPGSTRSGSSPGCAEAGRAPAAANDESARRDSDIVGGDAGDARADHARPPPNASASERQPG